MPVIYEPAGSDVHAEIIRIAKQYHGELLEAGVTFSALFAADEEGAAVKLHGYPCAAVIKINGYKDRVEGKADATITIDKEEWDDLTCYERESLLDHEIHHLELKHDSKTNEVKRDDLGRPKMGMRLHDHEFGWFDTIAHRHGLNSYEVKQARVFADEHGQCYFGWAAPPEPNGEAATKGSGAAVTSQKEDAEFEPDIQRINDAIGKRKTVAAK
jgi:hypothetical protein